MHQLLTSMISFSGWKVEALCLPPVADDGDASVTGGALSRSYGHRSARRNGRRPGTALRIPPRRDGVQERRAQNYFVARRTSNDAQQHSQGLRCEAENVRYHRLSVTLVLSATADEIAVPTNGVTQIALPTCHGRKKQTSI